MNHYIHAHDIKADSVSVSVSSNPYDSATLAIEITDENRNTTSILIYTNELLEVLAKFAQEAVAVR